MANTAAKPKQKTYSLDEAKIKRAQKLLGAKTERDAIELALDEVITERERTKRAWQAHERLLKAAINDKITIRDVYGVLED